MRARSRLVLLALAVAALVPSLGIAQYTPKWHVGDWWVVKTWTLTMSGAWGWEYVRYDIAGIDRVGNRDCYILEIRFQHPDGTFSQSKDVYYVRTDDWRVVRRVLTKLYGGRSLPPVTVDYPLGLFGALQGGEPRLPRFPLQIGSPDTTFRLRKRDDCSILMREISRIADSAEVGRLLGDEAENERVFRPTGEVVEVRSEVAGNLLPGPPPRDRELGQSIQLWCGEQPWRLYEEYVRYVGENRTRLVTERSWLIAVGHREK